jgi:hypothetical protein
MRWRENAGGTHCLSGGVSRRWWLRCGTWWLAAVYARRCGVWRAYPVLEQVRSGDKGIHGGDEDGVFHASASVSRWENGQDGKYKRAAIAVPGAPCSPRSTGEQGVMASERQARHSDRQSGANAQAINCHVEHETVKATRGTQEPFRCVGESALSQYAYAR